MNKLSDYSYLPPDSRFPLEYGEGRYSVHLDCARCDRCSCCGEPHVHGLYEWLCWKLLNLTF